MTREIEIIERLARIESKLDNQDEDIRELKDSVRSIMQALEERIKFNGLQDITIARIDERLQQIERRQHRRDWRTWSALIAAIGAIIQAFFERFFGR